MMKVSSRAKVYVCTCVTIVLSSLQSPNTSYILRVLMHYEEMHKKPYILVSHTSGYCFYGDVFCLGSIKDGFTVARIVSEQPTFFFFLPSVFPLLVMLT